MPSKQAHLIPEPLAPGVVLEAAQILQLVEAGFLIDPDTFDRRSLDACSYDVRIGNKGMIGGSAHEIDLQKDPLTLTPGGYAAVISHERVKIPDNMLARINAKRSIAYQGIALLTGTQVDPGYRGHLLFGFYNTSSRKVVLAKGQPICSLVFEPLATNVSKPKTADPDLLVGNFPSRFISDMANMEVLTWQELSNQIKRLDQISHEIIELRTKYNDVMGPITKQTENINKLTTDVDKLRESVALVADSTKKHGDRISDISDRLSKLSGQNKILLAIILLAIGALIAWGVERILSGWQTATSYAPASQSAPARP